MTKSTVKEDLELQLGYSFLIKENRYSSRIYKISVEEVTITSFKISFERSDGTLFSEWIEKKDFYDKNKVIENLGILIKIDATNFDYNVEEYPQSYTLCLNCNGLGKIETPNSTTLFTICPYCGGNGYILK